MLADIDLGRRPPIGGSDSGTKKLISPKLLGIEGCPLV